MFTVRKNVCFQLTCIPHILCECLKQDTFSLFVCTCAESISNCQFSCACIPKSRRINYKSSCICMSQHSLCIRLNVFLPLNPQTQDIYTKYIGRITNLGVCKEINGRLVHHVHQQSFASAFDNGFCLTQILDSLLLCGSPTVSSAQVNDR